jgi:hypothetical protein
MSNATQYKIINKLTSETFLAHLSESDTVAQTVTATIDADGTKIVFANPNGSGELSNDHFFIVENSVDVPTE